MQQNILINIFTKIFGKCTFQMTLLDGQTTLGGSINTSKAAFQRSYMKLFVMCLLMSMVFFFLNGTYCTTSSSSSPLTKISIPIEDKVNQIKYNAFIITAACNSTRFNITKQNIEETFPNLFNVKCFQAIPLNDSRIHTDNILYLKKLTSNLLAFLQIWSYEIPKHSKGNENQWSFVFEDDVNFVDPKRVLITNLTAPLQEILNNRQIQFNDGFLYLGICGPTYSKIDKPILMKSTNDGILSRKGYGFCLHATAITPKRSKLFWTEISSYRSNSGEISLDFQLRAFCMRSQTNFYILGTNLEFPIGTGHYGIAYQDRGRLSTTVSDSL